MGDVRAATIFSFRLRARSAGRCWSTGAGAGAWPGGGARASAGAAPPSSPPIVFCWREVDVARGRVGGEVLWCLFSSTVEARIGTQFRIEPLWMAGLVQDNQVSKKSRVAGGWASSTRGSSSRKERKAIQKKTSDKRARAWPFEVFVLAPALLGKTFLHCRNVPVPSQGQRVKDELGMRQGGQGGGPSRVGLCHDLHARFGKGARGEGAGGSFVQSLRGPVRGRSLSGWEQLKSEGLQEKFDVWSFGRWLTHLGPFPLRLVLPHRESWPTLKC